MKRKGWIAELLKDMPQEIHGAFIRDYNLSLETATTRRSVPAAVIDIRLSGANLGFAV